ncbi:type I restriction endonuclease subunit R [Pseudonocardia alni]|uniref:Type I restriction enzyme R subunit n=1 Tax=Pseudonocardia alni TaxID=33907 RepID=A0A852W2C6_PSEA5|nr:type I restriction endonuclease subunit R [Pseudonocardia antarctica]NYG00974.1 type I restriction enzyme R subunit [Pseudonocardia antarctica]
MSTDPLNEASLESLIVKQMVAIGWKQGVINQALAVVGREHQVGVSFTPGYGLDVEQLATFLHGTQPATAEAVGLGKDSESESPARTKFLAKLQGEITRNGVVHVLRQGFGHASVPHIDFYYPIPTAGNTTAEALHHSNRWVVARQVHYSPIESSKSLDLVAFVNGLPVATFELKNSITKQTVTDAVVQYQVHRNPKELLFQPGRCLAHFAVDDKRVKFCAELAGPKSWFLPFDKGYQDGAGNPPNPNGLTTDYLWRHILAPPSLANIIENFAQVTSARDSKTGKKSQKTIFPRYHQLDVVRSLLADVSEKGIGRRYLIQHSAGSGKSNSIAWLAHQLVEARHDGSNAVDSVLVVTDRRVLDGQIKDTIKAFTQVGSTVAHAEHSSDLQTAIEAGKRIIITTVQKFPYIVRNLGIEHRGRKFAVIIDEAHSSQTGKAAAALSGSLSAEGGESDGESAEDMLLRLVEQKKLPSNASYFAFTATPKNKTLELFGDPIPGRAGKQPFHQYTMKQAIQEGFILDVLQGFVTVDSYYKLVKTVEEDPEFDARKASKKLRAFVEGDETAIRRKSEIMVDHFHAQVIGKHRIGGKARAMVVTRTISRAIDYYVAIRDYLVERGSPYKAIVAFSDFTKDGKKVTEADYNRFPSKEIPVRIQEDPYRILVVADKYQTGYDEPLLHTMYVDKPLSGVLAVQTLSRLNRARPGKTDTAVLDFANTAEEIRSAFEPYFRMTVLADETDPDKLHDLQATLARAGVYSDEDVERFVRLFLDEAVDRSQLDPILDRCASEYIEQLDEDDQISFKSQAKAFVRTYSFLSLILPFTNVGWEKLSIFLGLLIPKLPAPEETDLSAGILETIDMDSYRIEKREEVAISLTDADGELEPVPTGGGGSGVDPALERLSEILNQFNDLFGNINWDDADRIRDRITTEIPEKVLSDKDYANARANNDEDNAKLALNAALQKVMQGMLRDETQLFKQFVDNPDFKTWLTDAVFRSTYDKKCA